MKKNYNELAKKIVSLKYICIFAA